MHHKFNVSYYSKIFIFFLWFPLAVASESPLVSEKIQSKPHPEATPHLFNGNKNIIAREYLSAQKTELLALTHRHKKEVKDLKNSQKLKLSEWEKSEKDTRNAFFQAHVNGPERRIYVQDFIKRREELKIKNKEELKEQQLHFEKMVLQLKTLHAENFRKFQESLKNELEPPRNLWPKQGG